MSGEREELLTKIRLRTGSWGYEHFRLKFEEALALLRAHDERVRAETLEEAAVACEGEARDYERGSAVLSKGGAENLAMRASSDVQIARYLATRLRALKERRP